MTAEQKKLARKAAVKKHQSTDHYKAKHAADMAARRARAPKWLTDDQKACMDLMYACARQWSIDYGQKLEIDHIEPINGKTVSGLHVPWNLQITAKEYNMAKGNRRE